MEEFVTQDFEKYQGSIQQLYRQRFIRRLAITALALSFLGLIIALVPTAIKIILALFCLPFILIDGYQTIKSMSDFKNFLSNQKEMWLEKIKTVNWERPAWQVFEDDSHYYVKQIDELQSISKKGSRTIPSGMRGISLIMGENSQLFAKEAPIFLVYCDTTDIKMMDLTKRNEVFLKKMERTKFKNKVVRPIIAGLLCLLVLLYMLSVIGVL